MRLGKGTIQEGGFYNENLLSSTFEAVVGAYYLDNDCDTKALKKIIEPLFDAVPKNIVVSRSNVDSKNRFQKWVQQNVSKNPPKYITIDESGLPHAPVFLAKVVVEGKVYGKGKGKNKKEAEKAAAEDALIKVGES